MNRTIRFVLPLAAILAMGCDNNPGKDKPQATVSSATPNSTSTAAVAGATTFNLSATNSKIEFTGAKITGKHNGSFGTFTGSIVTQGDKPETGKVTIEITMSSLKTDQEKLDGHLKSGDFFDVEKFPKATFVSSAIRATPGAAAPYSITGNLTMKGVTKSVTFPATIKLTADSVEATAEFAINRKDWGIVYPGKPDDLIKDEVLLKLTIKEAKAKG